MSDALHGIESDVPFDAATADALSTACEHAATAIQGQYGSRASWVATAMGDFKGYFSGLFQDNANTAKADAAELVDRLQELAKGARRLKQEAEKEQQRREKARKWKKEQDDRSGLDKLGDSIFGEDKPPVGPAADPVTIPISAPRSAPRQNPTPGQGGGGGGGTSSAKPADLTSFATNSASANEHLKGPLASVRSHLASFHSLCHWGTLDGSGVVTGFTKWLAANDEDVQWARVVADAFTKAGGSGGVATLSNSALLATLASHGVNAARADLTIAGPVAVGHPPTTGYAMDPVNTSTGNFVETETDLDFGEASVELVFTRTYNSVVSAAGLDVRTAGFGPGWSSWTDAGLRFDDEQARMVLPDGRQIEFSRLGAGWDRATGESLWLEADGSTYVARGNAGQRWVFGSDGLLREQSTGRGSAVALTWAERRLVRMDHARGRWVELDWTDGETEDRARVSAVRASDGRRVDFGYDERGRLVSATGPLGTRTYGWDDGGLVATVTGADGVVEVDNVYDDRGRVTLQRSPHGRDVRFVYLPGRVTVVSDEDGTRSNTWVADQRGRLVGVVDSEERRQSMAYDAHGNLVMTTERDGATTVRAYDARGRLVRTVSPSGADVKQSWDDDDRLVTVSAAADTGEEPAVTTFEYAGTGPDAERNPSAVVDPEGGRTEMVWQDGLLLSWVDATGVGVTYGYDEHGDLVSATDGAGGVARLERDDRGRVVAAVSPSGATHRLSYDAVSGMVTELVDPEGGRSRCEHDAAGRLVATVDATGGRTEHTYAANGEQARTIDPLGRVLERSWDELGNLSGLALPDGSTWRFAHDALSRLREITDPRGGTSRLDYDQLGRLTRAVDQSGVAVTTQADATGRAATYQDERGQVAARLDRLGRVVAEEQPDGSVSTARYDRCGRLVELIDATGVVTVWTRDLAGRVLSVAHPGAPGTTYAYDACGRLATSTDERGGTTTFTYDADGRLVERTDPAGDVATWTYDGCSRVVKQRVPGVGTTLREYDLAGRVVSDRDPLLGRRRFRYDAAGQLVEAIDANGGSTRFEHDALGRVVASTDPLGARTERTFDEQGNLVAVTDPLGRSTHAGYDAAGRQRWQIDGDGRRTEWTYDEAGRVASMIVDDVVVSTIRRDLTTGTVLVREPRPEGDREHTLAYDPAGRLLRRDRDGVSISWEYDAAGRRSAMVHPDGSRTTYERDAAGAVVAVQHPSLGRMTIERDVAGRVVSTTTAQARQRWDYADGRVVGHRLEQDDVTRTTAVGRDDDGRVVSLDEDGRTRTFDYDEGHQLVAQRLGDQVTRWRYDAAGRLVEELDGGTVRHLSYDAAGQLRRSVVERRSAEPPVVSTDDFEFDYDDAGRRVSERSSDGSERSWTWGPTGYLAGTSARAADGTTRETSVEVDALGELARVDDLEVLWDRAAAVPSVIGLGPDVVSASGPATGFVDRWVPAGWRTARSAHSVWDTTDLAGSAGSDAGVAIGAAGELLFAGLEWLGVRVYDQGTRGFLSLDPLDPVVGAAWAGNPYSYAGNDPLHAVDPWGLRPATDKDLQAYADAHAGAIGAAGKWLKNNWEYVAAGAMVVAGGALMFTPLGPTVGMGLISGGIDAGIQKAVNGHVNWGEVAVAGAMGAVGGAAATWAKGAATAAQGGTAALRMSVGVNAAVGGASNEAIYWVKGGPHTWNGALGAMTGGAVGGAVGGLAGPAGGTIARSMGQAEGGLAAKGVTTGLNFTAGFSGDMAGNMAAGNGIDLKHSATAGAFNMGTSFATDKVTGYTHPTAGGGSSMHDLAYSGTRTMNGLFHGPTGQAMLTGNAVGATLGWLGPS